MSARPKKVESGKINLAHHNSVLFTAGRPCFTSLVGAFGSCSAMRPGYLRIRDIIKSCG